MEPVLENVCPSEKLEDLLGATNIDHLLAAHPWGRIALWRPVV
jgi:hypothetical protein